MLEGLVDGLGARGGEVGLGVERGQVEDPGDGARLGPGADLVLDGALGLEPERLGAALRAADEAHRVVGAVLGQRLTVRPAMVIYGPAVPWGVASVGGVDVLSGRWLRKYLTQAAKGRTGARLDRGEIERIYVAAADVLPPVR
jgi:hypothetical protein